MIAIQQLMKCLSDETRLTATLLLRAEGELCVCELTEAMQLSQPKVSRHLAQLRACAVLVDARRNQWVYYRLNPDLPEWALRIVDAAGGAVQEELGRLRERLRRMPNRPAACLAEDPVQDLA